MEEEEVAVDDSSTESEQDPVDNGRDDIVDEESGNEKQASIPKDGRRNGHKYPKFHNLGHFPAEISMFGSAANFDTSTNEHNHIAFVKKTARLSKKNEYTQFLLGVANRTHENALVRIASCQLGVDWVDDDESSSDASNRTRDDTVAIGDEGGECGTDAASCDTLIATGSRYETIFSGLDVRKRKTNALASDGNEETVTRPTQHATRRYPKKRKGGNKRTNEAVIDEHNHGDKYIHGWGHADLVATTKSPYGYGLHETVMEFLRVFLYHDFNNSVISGCSELHRFVHGRKEILRCHPNLQGQGPWADWVMVKKEVVLYYMHRKCWNPPVTYTSACTDAQAEANNGIRSDSSGTTSHSSSSRVAGRTDTYTPMPTRRSLRKNVPVVNYAETGLRKNRKPPANKGNKDGSDNAARKERNPDEEWQEIVDTHVPCRVCGFITKLGQLDAGNTMNACDEVEVLKQISWRTDTSENGYAILRLTNIEPTQYQQCLDNVLLNRWEKVYYEDGSPMLVVIPVEELGQRVFVVQDFSQLFDGQKGFLERKNQFLNGDIEEECTSANGRRKYTRRKKKSSAKVPEDALACDWAYTVAPKATWPFKFFVHDEDNEKYSITKDQTGKVIYSTTA